MSGDWYMSHNGEHVFNRKHSMGYSGEIPDSFRPVVVIDPEDREQVERLMGAYYGVNSLSTHAVGHMKDALRSLRTPPRPDEPQGLGAVVEDASGCKWTLYTHPDSTAPWTDGSTSTEWEEVAAVRVLSEGWSA